MSKNYYEVLGFNTTNAQSITSDDITKAYRKMAMKYHPDRNQSNPVEAEEKFKEVQKAYDVLSDPNKRYNYDNYGSEDGLSNSYSDMGVDSSDFGFAFDFSSFSEFNEKMESSYLEEEKAYNIFKNLDKILNKTKEKEKQIYKCIVDISIKDFLRNDLIQLVKFKKPISKKANACSECKGTGKKTDPQFGFQLSCSNCSGGGSILEWSFEEIKIKMQIPKNFNPNHKLKVKGLGYDGDEAEIQFNIIDWNEYHVEKNDTGYTGNIIVNKEISFIEWIDGQIFFDLNPNDIIKLKDKLTFEIPFGLIEGGKTKFNLIVKPLSRDTIKKIGVEKIKTLFNI